MRVLSVLPNWRLHNSVSLCSPHAVPCVPRIQIPLESLCQCFHPSERRLCSLLWMYDISFVTIAVNSIEVNSMPCLKSPAGKEKSRLIVQNHRHLAYMLCVKTHYTYKAFYNSVYTQLSVVCSLGIKSMTLLYVELKEHLWKTGSPCQVECTEWVTYGVKILGLCIQQPLTIVCRCLCGTLNPIPYVMRLYERFFDILNVQLDWSCFSTPLYSWKWNKEMTSFFH